jgi:uncharacterized membrane protein
MGFSIPGTEIGVDEAVFAFLFFSFNGWAGECLMESVTRRRFVNKGFFLGPWVPVHGVGAFVVYILSRPLISNPLLVFLAGTLFCTALEYAAALILEKIFGVKCWDYATYPFSRWCHYKGRISLITSVLFGLMTLGVAYFYWDVCMFIIRAAGTTVVRAADVVFGPLFLADVLVTCGRYIRNRLAGIREKHRTDFS